VITALATPAFSSTSACGSLVQAEKEMEVIAHKKSGILRLTLFISRLFIGSSSLVKI